MRAEASDNAVGAGRRVAIVGAGPAGFYAAAQLLDQGFQVDMIDLLPTPFGLVRAGVAPDHPKIKSVERMYTKTARRQGFRFFGGIELGTDITRADLLARYHAVVYAIGTSDDNRLGIPGEDRPGSYPATRFVAWYNGHPHACDEEFDLSAERAVVIGNGNVAIDVARMLVLTPEELQGTDTADHAIDAFANSQVREVVLLGRRGPAQAAFTNPELLELGELERADVVVDPAEAELDPVSAAWFESEQADKTTRRNVEIVSDYAARDLAGHSHRVVLRFLRSPIEILGDDEGRVTGVRVSVNRIEEADGRLRAVPTGEEEVIECGLVLRSIGYRGTPLPGVPFDERTGLIRNQGGRVSPGEYAVGWIKRGPSGVIGTNKKCATETVAQIVEDREAGKLPAHPVATRDEVEAWLGTRVDRLVTWDGWTAIDEHETAAGEPQGRPRVKLVRVHEMHEVATSTSSRR